MIEDLDRSSTPPPDESKEEDEKLSEPKMFKKGDKVVGRASEGWIPGVIHKCHDDGTFDLKFDKGTMARGWRASHIRDPPLDPPTNVIAERGRPRIATSKSREFLLSNATVARPRARSTPREVEERMVQFPHQNPREARSRTPEGNRRSKINQPSKNNQKKKPPPDKCKVVTSRRGRNIVDDGMWKCPMCGEQVAMKEKRFHSVIHPNLIRKNIWLGNVKNARDRDLLIKLGVTHILNVAKEIPPSEEMKMEFTILHLALTDKSKEVIYPDFNEAYEFISNCLENGGTIFVHCRFGVSRSASFLAMYLMRKEKISRDAALALLSSKRHIVQPNSGFLRQLADFETTIKNEQKGRSRRKGRPRGLDGKPRTRIQSL